MNVPSGIQSQTYSRFHKFKISQKSVVEITVDSSNLTYPYLFLIKGDSNNKDSYLDGSAIGTDKSRIVSELNSGTYTIESTAQTRRNFTLKVKVSDCGVADALDPVLNNDSKSDDFSYNRRWTGTCLSSSSDRLGKLASFHSFTLKRSAVVRIDLTASDREPNPVLLVGTGITNSVVTPDSSVSNDDTAYRVYDELSAGTYTIEAVANSGEDAGNFTLDIEAYALNTLGSSGLYGTLRATYAVAEGEKYELQSYQSYTQYSPTGVTLRTTYIHATTLEGCLAQRDSNVLSGNPLFRPVPANAARRAMSQCAPKTGEPPTLLYHWNNFYGTRFSHGPEQAADATVVGTTVFPQGPASPYTLGWDIFFARDPAHGVYSVCGNCTSE